MLVLGWLLTLSLPKSDRAQKLYKAHADSVVLVEAEVEVETISIFDLLPPLMGFQKPQKKAEKRLETFSGTGAVVEEGIVTCLHVIEGSKNIHVTTLDGERLQAEVVRVDEKSDLALLRIKKWLPPLRVANGIEKGEKVVEIGCPLNLRWVLTIGKYVGFDGNDNAFDLLSEPGNSGSPILNRNGEIVGICHKILTKNHHLTFGGTIGELKEFLRDR